MLDDVATNPNAQRKYKVWVNNTICSKKLKNRTREEISAARDQIIDDLRDPQSDEERVQNVKKILILALNHAATEVNDPSFRTLINNNYFNKKGESYYASKKFRDGYPISFFSNNIIQNSSSSVINKYNTKAHITQE